MTHSALIERFLKLFTCQNLGFKVKNGLNLGFFEKWVNFLSKYWSFKVNISHPDGFLRSIFEKSLVLGLFVKN